VLDRKLIAAAMRDRGAYEAVLGSPAPETFDEVLSPVWKGVVRYYERDPGAANVDPELLGGSLAAGEASPKHKRQTAELIGGLANEDVSVENVRALIRDQQRETLGMALAAAIAGRKTEQEIGEALQAYEAAIGGSDDDDSGPTGPDWEGILRGRIDRSNRMPLSPRVLNQHIAGGVCPGHNITLFGRPEAGKTALALTMACGFARRNKRVLYIGNEDPVEDLMVRAITNLTDATADEVAQDPDRYERLALENGARNMVFRATAPGTIREIEALIKRHKPDVLFVDQLRNLQSAKSDNYTQLLDKNAQAVRALGKKYNLVTVSVTQAGDSATGRPILDMGDVDSSNTGIPGAADLMIGVGVTEALDNAGQRMLSLCKNKLGVVRAQVPVSLDPFRSKMK
jgi:archaellum biogenesis ATPase FlaH